MTAPTSPETGARRPGAAAPPPGPTRRRVPQSSGLPWILPAFALVVGLLYYCIFDTAYLSTLDWDGTSPTPTPVGMDNYNRILHDPIFWRAIWHTVEFLAVTFTVQTALGVVFAALLRSRI